MVSNKVVADKLREYFAARKKTKELMVELVVLAVELGAEQQAAINGGAVAFLDGYLCARDVMPEHRRENPRGA